ncbi:MAG: outer membrane beta-barrel protein [Flavobacteriales bacterium]|nr:outer membrane beta-barrel protein [Flavobacteriales bacterium]
MKRLLFASLFLFAGSANAQYNQKGMVHLGLGLSLGAHATELESRFTLFGITVTDTETDGAATTSIPIQVGYSIGNRFSLEVQLGAAGLRIQDDTPGAEVDARYSGGAFGLGTGLAFGLGKKVGIGLDLRYLATNMELRAMEVNDASVTDFYAATLRTSGVVAQISLAFRFGGGE